MQKKDIRQELITQLESSFSRLNLDYITSEQDNYAVHQTAFKKNARRTYCYILHKDKIDHSNHLNLVFRFRSESEIISWFKEQSICELSLNWIKRFRRVWSSETNTSSKFTEPALITDQYGIRVTFDDIEHVDFEKTLDLFIKIAVEAGNQVAKRKDRDWSRYEELIQ